MSQNQRQPNYDSKAQQEEDYFSSKQQLLQKSSESQNNTYIYTKRIQESVEDEYLSQGSPSPGIRLKARNNVDLVDSDENEKNLYSHHNIYLPKTKEYILSSSRLKESPHVDAKTSSQYQTISAFNNLCRKESNPETQ